MCERTSGNSLFSRQKCMRGTRALTFYFRMKHTIRGHERETNVETAGGEEKAAGRETERELSSRNKGRKRDFICALASDTGERESERDGWKDRERESRTPAPREEMQNWEKERAEKGGREEERRRYEESRMEREGGCREKSERKVRLRNKDAA